VYITFWGNNEKGGVVICPFVGLGLFNCWTVWIKVIYCFNEFICSEFPQNENKGMENNQSQEYMIWRISDLKNKWTNKCSEELMIEWCEEKICEERNKWISLVFPNFASLFAVFTFELCTGCPRKTQAWGGIQGGKELAKKIREKDEGRRN